MTAWRSSMWCGARWRFDLVPSRIGGRQWAPRVLAAPVAALGGLHAYLGVVTVAALVGSVRARPRHQREPPTTRFAVIVPAHDEAALIGDTVQRLVEVDYPAELLDVHVVADHCSDDTAAIARRRGALVHEHDDPHPRGKGAALRWALGRLDGEGYDAVVIVDADTVADRDLLRAFDRRFRTGAQVVQGYYAVREPDSSPLAGVREAALAVRHFLRPLGRTTIGASSGLYGNGMAFGAGVLRRHPPSDHLTEDMETQLDLVLAGIPIAFAPDAVVRAEMPSSFAAMRGQHERWERGRVTLARRRVPQLVLSSLRPRAAHRIARVDAAADALVPPLSVLFVATVVTTVATTILTRRATGAPARAERGVVVGCVAVELGQLLAALHLVRAPRSVYRSLLAVPRVLAWKTSLWVRVLVRNDVSWRRTERNLN